MLEHGGNVLAAAKRYGIAPQDWLDLSTGINPVAYAVKDINPLVWQRLPQADDDLPQVAAAYYGTPLLLPTAGTQAILQALPYLRPACRFAAPFPTYAEHPKAWQNCGHELIRFAPEQAATIVAETDVLLLCNPNNPSGHCYAKQDLLAWREVLAERGGWLIVDEAFVDSTPELSLAAEIGTEGLIVLRSLGKFFGLAGARVGFMLAWPGLLQAMAERLGPWPISGPARVAATQALADSVWQTAVKARLQRDMLRLTELLIKNDLHPNGGTTLYQWIMTPQAALIHEQLAQMGILTRLFTEPVSLRFGLPGTEAEWLKLNYALQKLIK